MRNDFLNSAFKVDFGFNNSAELESGLKMARRHNKVAPFLLEIVKEAMAIGKQVKYFDISDTKAMQAIVYNALSRAGVPVINPLEHEQSR